MPAETIRNDPQTSCPSLRPRGARRQRGRGPDAHPDRRPLPGCRHPDHPDRPGRQRRLGPHRHPHRHLWAPAERLARPGAGHRLDPGRDEEGRPRQRVDRAGKDPALGARAGVGRTGLAPEGPAAHAGARHERGDTQERDHGAGARGEELRRAHGTRRGGQGEDRPLQRTVGQLRRHRPLSHRWRERRGQGGRPRRAHPRRGRHQHPLPAHRHAGVRHHRRRSPPPPSAPRTRTCWRAWRRAGRRWW